jgi:hypothetical protein
MNVQKEQVMNTVLVQGGRLIGLLGILVMAVSVVARLAHNFTLGGFATGTLLLAGIGAVTVGCFLLLWRLAELKGG